MIEREAYKWIRPSKFNQKSNKPENRILFYEKLALTVIKGCRTVLGCKFKERLGFNANVVFSTKEKTVSRTTVDRFKGKKYGSSVLCVRQ